MKLLLDWCETLSWVLLLNSVCLNHDETEYQYKLDCLNCKEMFEKNFVHSAGNVAFRETLLTVLAQCLFDWNFLFTTNFSWYTVNHPQFFHWQARTHPLTTSTPPPQPSPLHTHNTERSDLPWPQPLRWPHPTCAFPGTSQWLRPRDSETEQSQRQCLKFNTCLYHNSPAELLFCWGS